MIYVVTILFTFCFALYSKFQFEERAGKSNAKWHLWGFLMRAIMFFSVGIDAFLHIEIDKKDLLLAGAINVILFEVLINVVALKQNIFYVGHNDNFDKWLGIWKWVVCLLLLGGGIAVKYL